MSKQKRNGMNVAPQCTNIWYDIIYIIWNEIQGYGATLHGIIVSRVNQNMNMSANTKFKDTDLMWGQFQTRHITYIIIPGTMIGRTMLPIIMVLEKNKIETWANTERKHARRGMLAPTLSSGLVGAI